MIFKRAMGDSEYYGKYLMSSHYLQQILEPEFKKSVDYLLEKGHAIRKPDGIALTDKWAIDWEKEKKLKKEKSKGPKKYCFITLQDMQRGPEDLPKLKQFIEHVSYNYSSGWWCIESGKKYLMSSHYLQQILEPEFKKSVDYLLEKGHAIRKPDGIALTDKWAIDWEKEKKLKKEKSKGPKKYCFITLQDMQRGPEDLPKLKQFIEHVSYNYSSGWWCIESGKKSYHIHLLVKIKNNKRHKDSLCIKWKSLFSTNLRDKDYYLLKTHNDSPDMPEYSDWESV